MRGWAEFVLRHRKWVMVFWLVIMVAGGMTSSTTSDRMTIDFSLPGQPGTEAAAQINKAVGNGGNTTPMLATITVPEGQTITGHEDEIASAFDEIGAKNPRLRVIDEANTGDRAFRTDDDRTAYAMVFYPFPQALDEQLPTQAIRAALTAATPRGATIGVTGIDALAVGDE